MFTAHQIIITKAKRKFKMSSKYQWLAATKKNSPVSIDARNCLMFCWLMVGSQDIALLAPTGALIVIVCYYWSAGNFFRF